MASKKDLVEAYAYNRRRLVTAFVSGAPGGREVEPSRPGRAIVAGIVLAVLVVGAGAATGVVKPSVEDGWDNNSIVVARKTGARYLAQNGNLFPVINTASARLLIPPEEFKVVFAPEDRIAKSRQGATIGIPGAPDAIPGPDDLIQSGWVSCVEDLTDAGGAPNPTGGISMRLSEKPTASPVPGQALVARVGKARFVVAGQMAYPLENQADSVVLDLGLADAVLDVPAAWVNQFTKGPAIGPLVIPDAGTVAKNVGSATKLTIGQLVLIDQRPHVVVDDGVVPLSDIQTLMLRRAGAGGQALTLTDARRAGTKPAALALADKWPDKRPVAYEVTDRTVACMILDASTKALASTTLAAPIVNAYLDPAPSGVVRVDSGRGALVSTGPGEVVYLVDAQGKGYPLGKAGEQAQLGFGATVPTYVPAAWILALTPGVLLSRAELEPKAATGAAATAAPVPKTTPASVPKATVAPVPKATVAPVPKAPVAPVPKAPVAPVPKAPAAPAPKAPVAPATAAPKP